MEPGLHPLPTTGRANVWRALGVTAFLAMALLWIFVFTRSRPDLVPGELADRSFPTAAEPTCARARAEIATLPFAHETPDPAQRAEVVDRATTMLETMLADLRAATPHEDPARTMVAEWLADWSTYVQNRRDYANRLRADPTAKFSVQQSERDNVQITRALDRFAKVNAMPSCATPDDVS